MSSPTKPTARTYLERLAVESRIEPGMKFRLTYEGELRPTNSEPRDNQKNPLAAHKHEVRRAFHRQLRRLWATDPFLSTYKIPPKAWSLLLNEPAADSAWARWAPNEDELEPLADVIAQRYYRFGYNFVPLVMRECQLLCSLNVLFLRREPPGSVIKAGDIDNRIKTLIDALRCPASPNELVGENVSPHADETPFYCLLEDDDQVSGLSVETDTLLDPPTGDDNDRRVKLVVTVEVRPYFATMFNLNFV